jgi:hypothetical protein
MNTVKHPDKQTDERTRQSVLRQLAVLQSLSLDELRDKWRDLYGAEPPRYQRQLLIKRLAYRIQELFHGGLSASAMAHLAKLAESDPVAQVVAKPAPSRSRDDQLLPGTRLIRIWNDQRHEVIAQADGFDYAGRSFRSLSAIAREITGTRWNGRVFFGLKRAGGEHAG